MAALKREGPRKRPRITSYQPPTTSHPRPLGRALAVHDLGVEHLVLAEVDQILLADFVRQQLREVLQRFGRQRRRHAAEERAELLRAVALVLIESEQTIGRFDEAIDRNLRDDLAEVRDAFAGASPA